MSNFIDNLKSVLDEEYNESVTENGAVGYKTTGKKLLDANFSISSFRNMEEKDVQNKFEDVYFEDKILAIKWLFYVGDVREGIGERRLFRIGMNYLAHADKDIAKALLPLIPEYTRWDNILPLLDTDLRGDVIDLIRNQLSEDISNLKNKKDISLLGKWMPSRNASSKTTKRYARILTDGLGLTDRLYQKMLSKLRAYLKVVETYMSKNEWSEIDYSAVPSRANLIYKNAFMEHDTERRTVYLDSLTKGETKINGKVLFPHDIINKYNSIYKINYDISLEELWKTLPDYVDGNENTICVADGSGSMFSNKIGNTNITCLDVCTALSIYFSEKCSGQFKDKYITFSTRPQLVDLSSANTLRDKILISRRYNEVADTNIEAVFDLILKTAISNNMLQDEMPKNIVIMSDMEFNKCTCTNNIYDKPSKKLFKYIEECYNNAGYKLPRLVFWNINSRTNTIPIKENELGVTLVSGFSPAIINMVLSNKTDPFECLLEQLHSPRYNAVNDIIKQVLFNF